MHIKINGKLQDVPGDMAPLSAILEFMGLDTNTTGIAVALNLQLVSRDRWSTTMVEPQDEVEIVTARQGG
jgi:thiamine biosynthesis protein ThiS